MTADDGGWYVHCIDASDRIVSANPLWMAFARANGARPATLGAVGTSLWEHIAGDEVQQLYVSLLRQVRRTGRSVRVPFRCDAPTLKRFMEMVIVPQPDGCVAFRSQVLRQQGIAYVALLDPAATVSDEYLRICSWCRRVALPQGEWVEAHVAIERLNLFSSAPIPRISHALCPSCDHDIRAAAGLTDA